MKIFSGCCTIKTADVKEGLGALSNWEVCYLNELLEDDHIKCLGCGRTALYISNL